MKDTEFEDNRYLWDRRGPADLEVARLERTLAPFRYRGQGQARLPFRRMLATAAVAAVACLLVWLSTPPPPESAGTAWTLIRNGQAVREARPGMVIETGVDATAELHSRALGMVSVNPESRVRLLANRHGQERFALDYGKLRAIIVAPPAKLAIDTPVATAIDLGCVYTLESNREGDGRLRVEVGWVALQTDERESFIPAGAEAGLHRRTGPGIPLWKDAPADLRAAIERSDRGEAVTSSDLLAAVRPKDAFTLWHLLPRVDSSTRAIVAERFATYVTLPKGVTAAELASLNPLAMDAAWNALDLGDTSWWRTWKHRW